MMEKERLERRAVSLSIQEQERVARYLRYSIWETVATAQSGHLGGTSSSTELLTALYFGGTLNYDPYNPNAPDRDRVMIRGYMGPLRYNLFSLLGWVNKSELSCYRQLGSQLQGHEMMGTVPGIDITPSGSLGMLLSYGVGSALVSKTEDRNYRSFVFLGDGEEQEGNVAEAARNAVALKLDNLICIIDQNRKQLSRPNADVDVANLVEVWAGYGWEVFEISDGHDLAEINKVIKKAVCSQSDRPRVIIAHTKKGYGLPGAEGDCGGYHTIGAFGQQRFREFVSQQEVQDTEQIERLVKSIIPMPDTQTISPKRVAINGPELFYQPDNPEPQVVDALMNLFKHVGTLMKRGYPVYLMTADLIRKDQAIECGLEGLPTYIDVGIREQHLFATAHGISVCDDSARVIVNSNDAFLYRAADQIHAISQGKSRVIVFADDGGLSGAHNGETHQSTGQPGMLTMMSSALLFEPADAQDFWRAANYSIVNNPGLVYIRLFTGEAPLLPKLDKDLWFYRTFEPEKNPQVILISCGLTGYETYQAAQLLEKEDVSARAINVVNFNSVRSTEFTRLLIPGIPVLTIYNGNPLVLQSMVSSSTMEFSEQKPSLIQGHGFTRGTSGSLHDLKRYFELDAKGIVKKTKELLRSGSQVA